jgi:hypothetical protein
MMKHLGKWLGACAAAAAVGLVLWRLERDPASPPLVLAAQNGASEAEPATRAVAPVEPPRVDGAPESAGDAHTQRLEFHESMRSFFAQAPAMGTFEKRERAVELARELDKYEAAREVSAGEAFMLRTALVRESEDDPAEQAREIEALRERYEARTAARLAAWSANRDPMFELYKVREQQIVTQVMAMESIPGGASREEYLREQLQRERERLGQ